MKEAIRIGVICPSEIATRRFMPALVSTDCFDYVGVGTSDFPGNREKTERFRSTWGGKIFDSYAAIATSCEIDALYIPLPPALHFQWAETALNAGKHVLVEKPATTSHKNTSTLVRVAESAGLALHENYYFPFHKQLDEISAAIRTGEIGDVRLCRIDFGFPKRAESDFRYKQELGGGALLDCGGYVLRYASMLLGESYHIASAHSITPEKYEVDLYGAATLANDAGVIAQVAFGMDNDYRCSLDIWGSTGSLYAGRVLTAPSGYVPELVICRNGQEERRQLSADDAFASSIKFFFACIQDDAVKRKSYATIVRQARLIEDFRTKAVSS